MEKEEEENKDIRENNIEGGEEGIGREVGEEDKGKKKI